MVGSVRFDAFDDRSIMLYLPSDIDMVAIPQQLSPYCFNGTAQNRDAASSLHLVTMTWVWCATTPLTRRENSRSLLSSWDQRLITGKDMVQWRWGCCALTFTITLRRAVHRLSFCSQHLSYRRYKRPGFMQLLKTLDEQRKRFGPGDLIDAVLLTKHAHRPTFRSSQYIYLYFQWPTKRREQELNSPGFVS